MSDVPNLSRLSTAPLSNTKHGHGSDSSSATFSIDTGLINAPAELHVDELTIVMPEDDIEQPNEHVPDAERGSRIYKVYRTYATVRLFVNKLMHDN